MRTGIVIEDTWAFFNAIYAELESRHTISRFQRRTLQLPAWLPLSQVRLDAFLLNRDLQGLMRSNQVVFFEWASDLLRVASQQPKTCGLVTRLHRYEMYQPWLAKIHWQNVDQVIVVSQAKSQELLERFPELDQKIIVIPEAVSLEKFAFQPRPFQGDIGILCTLLPRKRVYELILAFEALLRQQPGFHLHIGGGAHALHQDYVLALHHLVAQLGLEQHVTFYGQVSDPPGWYRNIDIFVSNSYSEGLQVSPMEAAASGVYCLTHRWPGAQELFPQEQLFTTQAELVERILHYSQLDELRQHQELLRLREHVAARFDERLIAARVRQVIEQVGAGYPHA